jgi:four helix bundle protein
MPDHKSLQAWQEAHAVVNLVLDFAKDRWKPYLAPIYSQLNRAALSIQLNISEGYGFGSNRRFVHHLKSAKGSTSETLDLLELLAEREEVPVDDARRAIAGCQRCRKLLYGLIQRYERTDV